MTVRRLWYLAALLGCWVFYIAYGEWFSYLLLVAVGGLPWLSLLVSVSAMRQFRVTPAGPDWLLRGGYGELWLVGSCGLPMPPFRGRIRLQNRLTGETRRYEPGEGIPAGHCGGITATVEKPRVCDYLGLFALPVKQPQQKTVLIRPVPIPVPVLPDLHRYLARAWRPKFGGGFAENHELRLYRPGDSLNQVHWKLSAKTGKLILREPMEPERGLVLLTMTLGGTPEELDRKFGRLLWLGNHLLEQNVHFELRVLTGEGLLSYPIAAEQGLTRAIDALLCTSVAREGSIREQCYAASWQYHIGGEPDEA